MSFFANLLKWGVARFGTDANNNTVLKGGPDGDILLLSGDIVSAFGTAASLASGYTAGSAATAASMTAKVVDTDGALLDLVNDYVVVPADATHVKVSANVLFAANATGQRYVALEQYFKAILTWVPLIGFYEERAALASGATPVSFTATLGPVTPSSFPRLRLGVGQNSGVALNCTLVGVTFEFLKIA